jgi:hypothetical protein
LDFEAKRIRRHYCQTINSTPDIIFPLLCPVREAEWLDGWGYQMLYSQTGVAELGAVFSTSFEREQDTIWIITKHDALKHELEFARVTPNSRTSTLTITVRSKDIDSSYVDIAYTYTGITPAGNQFIDGYSEEVFWNMVTFWERSMNYFLVNGKMLKMTA